MPDPQVSGIFLWGNNAWQKVLIDYKYQLHIVASWVKDKNSLSRSGDMDELANTINEQSSEQRKTVNTFNKAMNNFASERSLESCLEALNASMQIANIRGKLVECYEYYARLLEREIVRLKRTDGTPAKP